MTKPNGFIRIERDLWVDPAVAELPALCQLVLVDMLYRYNGRNNGAITYSWDDAQRRLGCSRRTVGRLLATLREAGLVEIATKGSFDHKDGARKGTANRYRLTFVK